MIVKILSSSATFAGVAYNTNKMDSNRGELMAVRNFGALQVLANLRPEDYKNYLKMVSGTNKAVKKPQFHVAISAESRSYDKYQLTGIAEQWLQKMGYGEQPYLIVFHKDTNNNHVHIVSTRVDKHGKKINSGFENIRAQHNLNQVLGIDEKHNAQQDAPKALAYSFSTRAQFMMILESQGYRLLEKDGVLKMIKFGKIQGTIDMTEILARQAKYQADKNRQVQLKALFNKYATRYDMLGFCAYMKAKHGIVIMLHAKNNQRAYGYSIIDHAAKAVYKGSEVMSLDELLKLADASQQDRTGNAIHLPYHDSTPLTERRVYYQAMLKAALNNYPDIRQGLHATGINIYLRNERYYLVDHLDRTFIPLDQLMDGPEYSQTLEQFAASGELETEIYRQHIYVPAPHIEPSIDDEAINGRNRRRKKHPRTNSR